MVILRERPEQKLKESKQKAMNLVEKRDIYRVKQKAMELEKLSDTKKVKPKDTKKVSERGMI